MSLLAATRTHLTPRRLLGPALRQTLKDVWRLLPFAIERQTQSNWCWAACTASVSRFYDAASPWAQCQLADAELGQSGCCQDGATAGCNQAWYLDRALARTRNFVRWEPSQLAASALEAEIEAGRVVAARVAWQGGGGHFVIIGGCKPRPDEQLEIHDPFWGSRRISREEFTAVYQGNGSWVESFLTSP